MSNHKEVLSAAISEAQRGLAMWGWDAAVPSMMDAGVKVEFRPIDQERHPVLQPFAVELTTHLWDGTSEDPADRNVIYGTAYGLSIRDAFIAALDDLSLKLNEARSILTDSEIWP